MFNVNFRANGDGQRCSCKHMNSVHSVHSVHSKRPRLSSTCQWFQRPILLANVHWVGRYSNYWKLLEAIVEMWLVDPCAMDCVGGCFCHVGMCSLGCRAFGRFWRLCWAAWTRCRWHSRNLGNCLAWGCEFSAFGGIYCDASAIEWSWDKLSICFKKMAIHPFCCGYCPICKILLCICLISYIKLGFDHWSKTLFHACLDWFHFLLSALLGDLVFALFLKSCLLLQMVFKFGSVSAMLFASAKRLDWSDVM